MHTCSNGGYCCCDKGYAYDKDDEECQKTPTSNTSCDLIDGSGKTKLSECTEDDPCTCKSEELRTYGLDKMFETSWNSGKQVPAPPPVSESQTDKYKNYKLTDSMVTEYVKDNYPELVDECDGLSGADCYWHFHDKDNCETNEKGEKTCAYKSEIEPRSGTACSYAGGELYRGHVEDVTPHACRSGHYSTKNPCKEWLSQWGWCGNTAAHRDNGTDCRGLKRAVNVYEEENEYSPSGCHTQTYWKYM